MQIETTTKASMSQVMTRLLGTGSLTVSPKGGTTSFEITSRLGGNRKIEIIRTNTNSDRRIRVPVKVPSLGIESVAVFDYAVGDTGEFEPSIHGLTIIIE